MAGSDDDFDALFDEISALREAASINPITSPKNIFGSAGLPGTAAPSGTDRIAPEQPMFTRLGEIVRLLHDSLRELGYDRSLSNVASEIIDAKDRLEYVASLTEQAANKVLNAIDIGMPAQDVLAKTAKEMDSRWAALFEGDLSIDEFKQLAYDSRAFAATVAQNSDDEKARLLEIMMAQDFQDITGQVIKKIVIITHTAEKELAQLLRDNVPTERKAIVSSVDSKQADLMSGPAMAGVAMAQDSVDDLLENLGF